MTSFFFASEKDFSRLLELKQEWFEYEANNDNRLDKSFSKKGLATTLKETLADNNSIIIIARDSSVYIGFVSVQIGEAPPHAKPTNIGLIRALYVRPEARRSGVATKLIEKAHRWAKEHGATRVSVSVNAQNTQALSFYKKSGYHPRLVVLSKELPNRGKTL
ncbi:GNAT family N-acetyltransferase [Candidatus Woesearchaeota archaeon]|nr:MAG: GNAT family N-acetyltransferase [Candidatus Woesearchaeota archaeon]